MKKNGVLILECMDLDDPGSEGRFIKHMLDVMNVKNKYIAVKSKDQMINSLKQSKYKYIHITTHGSISEDKTFLGFWTPKGVLYEKLLDNFNHELDGCVIVSTACQSADPEFRDMFFANTLCDLFIAPMKNVKFTNSIFFSHIFYHKLFILNKDARTIIREYSNQYKNPDKFCLFSFADFVEKIFE